MPLLKSQIEVFTKNSPNQKVAALSTEVSIIQGQLVTLMDETITTVQDNIETIQSNYSSLLQNYEGFKTEVGNTYITQDDFEITQTLAEQTSDKFNWLVSSGDSASNFVLTSRVANLLSDEFQIDALTTFKDKAINGTETVINGGSIITGSISADKLNVDDLSALEATIGGFGINSSAIYKNSDSFGTANGMYFGINGISMSDKWKVNPNGEMTASKVTIQDQNDKSLITAQGLRTTYVFSSTEWTRIGCYDSQFTDHRDTLIISIPSELEIDKILLNLDMMCQVVESSYSDGYTTLSAGTYCAKNIKAYIKDCSSGISGYVVSNYGTEFAIYQELGTQLTGFGTWNPTPAQTILSKTVNITDYIQKGHDYLITITGGDPATANTYSCCTDMSFTKITVTANGYLSGLN